MVGLKKPLRVTGLACANGELEWKEPPNRDKNSEATPVCILKYTGFPSAGLELEVPSSIAKIDVMEGKLFFTDRGGATKNVD